MELNNLTYEEAVQRLEALLLDMEEEDCTLDDSIKKFKEANDLYKYCHNILKKAEGEVKIILEDGDIQDFNVIREDEYGY